MREVTVHNWDELQKVIFEDVWDESIMRYRSNSVYRGMGSAHWGLLSSLNRVCAHDLSLEKQMLRSLKKYGYADLDQSASFWQFLVIGQQFGLPTRLLDWTYSPLVAAHFATEDQKLYDRDGVIYKADVNRINTHLPPSLQEMLHGNRANIFSMDELEQLGESFDSLKRLENAGQPFALFFEPASMVDRIANQYALFSVTSSVQTALDTLPYAEECFSRIVIPARVKLEIRDKLDYINISERMIYPGLDGICKWITRRYAPLGPVYNAARDTSSGSAPLRKEKSCGAVIFARRDQKLLYLIEIMQQGHVSLCKGHVESGETEQQTAAREIMEETSLSVTFIPPFRETITYSPRPGRLKDVVFFLAETKSTQAKPQPSEVQEIRFLPYEQALALLTYEDDRNVLTRAHTVLTAAE